MALRLPFHPPLCPDNLFGHLVATAVPGVEEWLDGAYRRTLRLVHGPAIAALRPGPGHIDARLVAAWSAKRSCRPWNGAGLPPPLRSVSLGAGRGAGRGRVVLLGENAQGPAL